MRRYKDYLDSITVSEELHKSILSIPRYTHDANISNGTIANEGTLTTREVHSVNTDIYSSQVKQKKSQKRFAWMGITAIAAVLLFGVILGSHFSSPTPFSPLQPGPSITVPEVHEYQLDFNKANTQTAAKLFIPGHFWQELSQKELQAVFPSLINTHNLTATANFQSDERGIALFNIVGQAISSSGLKTKIQIAPEKIIIDYVLDGEVKTSHVQGTEVLAGYFETKANSQGLKNVIYFANFNLAGIAYYVELGGPMEQKEALMQEISGIIGLIIEGGPVDLDVIVPLVPELRDERLSLEEARRDTTFGAYIPSSIPQGFVFEIGHRFINQIEDSLTVTWTKGMGYINWKVSKHLQEIVDNPIFQSNELTLDTVNARSYQVNDAGDEPGERMKFSVLYGDIVIEISSKGPSAEEIYSMLQDIPISR